jgi:hypothetical protein
MFRHGIVTYIGMGVSANETAKIPRPEVKLARLRWRLHAKVTLVTFTFFQGLVMAAHWVNRNVKAGAFFVLSLIVATILDA